MIGDILTEQEDQLLQQVKSQFYYPQSDGVTRGVETLLSSLPVEDRIAVLQLAIGQIRYEQTLRRRFILNSLYSNYDLLNKIRQENLVMKIAGLFVGATPPSPSTDDNYIIPIIGSITQQILEQAQIFLAVEEQLNYFTSVQNLTSPVRSIYRSLKKLPIEEIEKLRSSVQQFIAGLAKQDENIFSFNPEIPAPIVMQLNRAGLELSIAKYKSLGEKLRFLGLILLITSVISRATEQSLSLTEDQELFNIGRLMAAQGVRFNEE